MVGCCIQCHQWSEVVGPFDEKTNKLKCPNCGANCSLTRKTLDQVKKELHLAKSELTNKPAIVASI